MSGAEIALLIVVNTAAWLTIHIACAWLGSSIPLSRFHASGPLLRIRPWESDGQIYQRALRVKIWKELLPDGAKWIQGGFEKKRLASRDPDYLRDFLRETRRAELIHWVVFWSAALFYFWNPAWVVKWMFLYSAIVNLPCIIAQRYNRGRFERVMEKCDEIQS